MIRFRTYLLEARTRAAKKAKISSNTKGVMHELLVGFHLNGRRHMDKHPEVNGLSPEEAHDKLKASLSKEEYDQMNEKAKFAADDIRKQLGKHGEIQATHWTSKKGDIGRSTGIESSQEEDASDIVVTTQKGKKKKFHGISLKVTDKKKGNVPVSNPGMASTLGADHILQKHRDGLDRDYPALRSKKEKERREFVKNNPEAEADIRKRNSRVLTDIVDHTHAKLSELSKEELAHHIRHHILRAVPTPMQTQGHNHIRHTTNGADGNYTTHSMDPTTEHEDILNDHENITVHKSGTSIIFKHNNKPFARQRKKFSTQSDPKSAVKGSGELIG